MPDPPFTDEHAAVRAAGSRWALEQLAPHADDWDEAGATPAEAIARAGADGWLTVAAGGPAATDPLALVALAEGLAVAGAGPALAILAAAVDALPLLAAAGHEWSDEAASGTRVVALAATGAGEAVVNGVIADGFVAVDGAGRPSDDGSPRFVAHGRLAGDVRPVPTLGMRAAGLADVPAPAGEEDRLELTHGVLATHRDQRRLARAALATACAQRSWDGARTYALQREAFGRPIGQFQVNRHALARTATVLVAARQLVLHAAVTSAEGAPAATAAVAAAYDFASRTAVAVTDTALQLHGGYGYAAESVVSRAWRDARFWQSGRETLRPHTGNRHVAERMGAP